MFAYLGLTSSNSFLPNFTRFGVVEPYQANLGLSVLRYKTLISQGSIISHDLRHVKNIVSTFFFQPKAYASYFHRFLGAGNTLYRFGDRLSRFRTQALYQSSVYLVLTSWNSPNFTWFGSVEAYHANFGVLRRLRSRFSGFKCLGSDHQTQQTSPPKVARSLVLNNKQENWALNATENKFSLRGVKRCQRQYFKPRVRMNFSSRRNFSFKVTWQSNSILSRNHGMWQSGALFWSKNFPCRDLVLGLVGEKPHILTN